MAQDVDLLHAAHALQLQRHLLRPGARPAQDAVLVSTPEHCCKCALLCIQLTQRGWKGVLLTGESATLRSLDCWIAVL
jgi:hypothetical protein